jgi:membrane protein implicated in regulation of membrane protease activity
MDYLFQALGEGWKLWLIIGIVFFMAEGVSAGTFSLFFGGVGALATAASCYVFPSVAKSGTFQLLLFAAMSLSSLLLMRSRLVRLLHKDTRLDGPDAYMGRQGKTITALRGDGGRILFDGTEWSALPAVDSPEEIPAGSPVEIVKMEGLTLLVKPVKK